MNIMNNKLTNSKQTGIIAVSLAIVLMGLPHGSSATPGDNRHK